MVSQDLLHDDSVGLARQEFVQIDVPVVMRRTLGQANQSQARASPYVELLTWVLCHLDPLLYGVPQDEESSRGDCVGEEEMLAETRSPDTEKRNSELGEHSNGGLKRAGMLAKYHRLFSVKCKNKHHKKLAYKILVYSRLQLKEDLIELFLVTIEPVISRLDDLLWRFPVLPRRPANENSCTDVPYYQHNLHLASTIRQWSLVT